MSDVADALPVVVLGGYPAKLCARAVHNDFSPASPPRPPVDAATQQLFDAGIAFEDHVNAALAAAGALLLSDEGGWGENIEATLAAMREGVAVIVNGRLPKVGSRAGAPDVLVRVGEGYVPVDVKLHGTRNESSRGTVQVSTLAEPAVRRDVKGLSQAGHYVESDGMQLAHYTRMLLELGLHAGPGHLVGGIIGQSDYTDHGGDPWLVQWYDLGVSRKATFSASAAGLRAKRSLLDRYDHEFDFRVDIARTAKAGGELVRPFHVAECGRCVWIDYCRDVAGADDASFATRTGLPTAQQWRHLYDDGVATTQALAALDPDAPPAGWSPRDPQPGSLAEAKFRALVRRARMREAGVEFEPNGVWPDIPSADVEIDFDIEWDFEQRIYLWGLRVREGQDDATAVFDPVVSYDPIDDAGAAALAGEFAARLGALITGAERADRSVRIFHWSHPERSMTAKYPEVAALLEGRTLDLMDWFKTHFLAAGGNSLKSVAPLFGFAWDVEDAGGSESQVKIDLARAGGPEGEAAREWLTRYNGSDVAAQAAIRDGLRRAHRSR